jgi:hypothetical protein
LSFRGKRARVAKKVFFAKRTQFFRRLIFLTESKIKTQNKMSKRTREVIANKATAPWDVAAGWVPRAQANHWLRRYIIASQCPAAPAQVRCAVGCRKFEDNA